MIEQYHQQFFSSPSHFFAAPVARLLRFYNIPLLTAGGLALDYTNDKRDPGEELQSVLESYLGTQGVRVMKPPPSLRIPL